MLEHLDFFDPGRQLAVQLGDLGASFLYSGAEGFRAFFSGHCPPLKVAKLGRSIRSLKHKRIGEELKQLCIAALDNRCG